MTARADTGGRAAGWTLKARAALAIGSLWLVFLLLIVRLAHLQIADADLYLGHAARQQILSRELSAWRGRLYDRKGRLLAASVQRYSVYADPHGIVDPAATARALASVLDVPAGSLEQRLHRDCYFVWVRRQIPDALAVRVRGLGLRGVHMQRESKRLYPQGKLAAHVIGFTDIDGRGLAGVEKSMDALLRGRPGAESVLCDGSRRIFRSARDQTERTPLNGLDVHLTLDAYVQEIAEEELAKVVERHEPECAAAVVLDARDCSVLAMASWPGFDPQAPAQTPLSYQRNVAVNDAYEFGSVMKPFAISMALDGGVVEPETQFDCHQGVWRIGRRTLHDAHAYGMLTVSDILCHSSNIGAAQISLLLGCDELYRGVRDFGFGRPGGIALPGETGGIVRPLAAWNQYSVVSVAFGQELAVTPLSVAQAFAAFSNRGFLLQPRIVSAIKRPDTRETVYDADEPIVGSRVISPATAREVMEMMRRVVEEGTGKRARLDEYTMAGKTGTAQLLRDDGRGYSDSRYLSSFVGIAPVEESRVVVLVCLKGPTKNGYYGGVAAAPAVREIVARTLRYLGVPPGPPDRTTPGESA